MRASKERVFPSKASPETLLTKPQSGTRIAAKSQRASKTTWSRPVSRELNFWTVTSRTLLFCSGPGFFFALFCRNNPRVSTNLSEKTFGNGNESQLAILMEASQVLNSELSTHVAFKQLLDNLKQRCGVSRGVVFLFDPGTDEIRIAASAGFPMRGDSPDIGLARESPARLSRRANRLSCRGSAMSRCS